MTSPIKVEAVSIEVKDLHKSYGAEKVLTGISFAVKPGEIFVLMGPSGSGKSVLLRQIIGLEHADSGEVFLNDLAVSDPETHRKIRSAMVFQAGALFNSMTVYENLALYHREHGLYNEKILREKVLAVAEALSIGEAMDKIPAALSGGMRKRVAVARAIIMEPQLIFFDEPTSELDPILAATTSELIATISRETGGTSLVVTHDKDLAMGIADRVGLIRDGQLCFVGTPEELAGSKDEAVQEFLNPRIDLDNPRFRNKEINQ